MFLAFVAGGAAQAGEPAIATSLVNGMALHSDGTVRAWGADHAGQLGVGRVLQHTSALPAAGTSGFSKVSAGTGFTLALKPDGTVWSWGGNASGNLGDGTTQSRSSPRRVGGLDSVTAIAAGHNHAAAVKSDGTVWAWGYNLNGSVGNGTSGNLVLEPVRAGNLTGVVAVAVGTGHTLALRSDGTVWAWGYNQQGAVGDGSNTDRVLPVQVPGLTGIVAIAASGHSVALKNDGSVWAWGPNNTGQLGDGGFTARNLPFRLTSITGVSAIAAGDRHTLALRAGEVWSWGEGAFNQLGDGSTANRSAPGRVTGLSGVTAIWAGRGYHGFARLSDGTMRAWGFNAYGQLGDGTTTNRALPTLVQNAGPFNDFSAGFYHTAAVRDDVVVASDWETVTIADGVVVGWGNNSDGQLADGAPVVRSTPVTVAGAAGITAIAGGGSHALALRADGSVIAWGGNSDGELGDGTTTSRSTPVEAIGVTGADAIAAGLSHSLALRSGTVWGWGNNQEGQLGDNTLTRRGTAVQTANLTGVSAIAAAWAHSAALRSGVVWTWGNNESGQLGDGSLTRRAAPVEVPGLAGVSAISAGGDWNDNSHTLALRQGQVWAWGANARGQLGDGTTTRRLTPVVVPGLTDVVAISAGGGHSAALRSDGTVWTWGYNHSGQLGDGTTTNRLSPVQVAGLTGIVAIAAGREFTMALKADGTVLSWGWAQYGSNGDGTFVTRLRPVVVVSEDGAGALDANNWYLQLGSAPTTVPASLTPSMLAIAQQSADGGLDATVRYLQSDLDRAVNHFVLALVEPEFFGMVGNAAASLPPIEALRAKAVNGLVLAQLTPQGWTAVSGSLDAFSQGISNAAGGSTRILDGVPLGSLAEGTRFCIGYGETSQSMLGAETMREVLRIGAPTSVESGVPCVLSGVYLDGPRQSLSGTPVTFNASVVGASPTGTVQFRDGSLNLLSPVALAAANPAVSRASITTASLSVGEHSIIARYSGDALNTWGPAADVTPIVHVVASAQSGTSVSLAGPASSSATDEVAFVAAVTGNNPGGTVQFRDGGASLGAPVPVVGGQATLRTAALAAGSHSLTADYSGDASNAPSTSPALSHTVYAAVVTQVALASSLNPATSGDMVTFTATVTGNNPQGSVTFRAGGASLGTASMSGGVASLSTASLTAGTHYIVADYAGDANNQRVTSSTLSQVVRLPVTRSSSGTTLDASPSPSTLAQSVTFTAHVSAPGTPTGTVTFRAGATPIAGCGAVALAGGPVTCRTNALPAGTHSITAEYSGNDNLMPSTSLALSHRVDAGATSLSASPATLDFGGQSMNTTSPVLTTRFTNAGPGAVTVAGVSAPAGFAVTAHDCGALAAGASCDVQVRFTPDAQGAFDGLLALSHAGGGPAVARLAGVGERSLVTHYYRAILRRAADAGGAEYWAGEAARVAGLGANLNETWYAMALQFYESPEYRNFNRDDTGFLADLYATFFNRTPDAGGLQYWQGLVAQGMPREVVLVSFLFSPEFTSFAQAIFGNTAARAEVDMVVDFYRGLLSRLPDTGGFQYWTGRFRTAQCQSPAAIYAEVEAISSAYVNSPEYGARGRTAAQFVGDMYNAFMRRGGDLDGVRFWISQLEGGARSREDVRRAFISTPEFAARVQAVVAQGCQR